MRDVFAENFELRGELGAAFAATRDGELVVDLWGGIADPTTGRPWDKDTPAVIFSGTKGLVALCLLILADRGRLDLDAPVCCYWPEFAVHQKHTVTVIDLASHAARLPGLRTSISADDVMDDARMAALLAQQPQEEDPRSRDVYHALTYGWLCGEVIQRVDGRSVGRFFADEVAEPLGLQLWIGIPREIEASVARLQYAPNWGASPMWDQEAADRDELLARVWHNPPFLAPGQLRSNRADWHCAEIPGIGGIGTARSLARLYGCLAMGGEHGGVRLLSTETLRRGRVEVTRRVDPLLNAPMAFGVGFQLQTERRPYGPPDDAFGHSGAGGSNHCAWPSQRVGVSYVMNLLRNDEEVDPRAQALLRAVHDAIA